MATTRLALRDVTTIAVLLRSAIYTLTSASRLPKLIRASHWVESEVLDFIASQPHGGPEQPAA